MKELQRKQNFKRFLYSIPFLVLLVLMTVLLVRGAINIMAKRHESAARLEQLNEENVVLRERQMNLKADITKLQTQEGVENEIRAKFNAAREGEHLAVIVETEAEATVTPPTTIERIKRGWGRFLNLWGF